jgi:hypothetical protein
VDPLEQRRMIARHLRAVHGYITLDTEQPVSLGALMMIIAQCGCRHRPGE